MTKTSDYNAADPWQIIADLQRRLDESFAQQAATAEVMQLINTSPGDLTPVFDAIVDKAMHLCGAGFGGLWVVDGDMARAAATRNLPEPYVEFLTRRPVLLVGAIPFDRLLVNCWTQNEDYSMTPATRCLPGHPRSTVRRTDRPPSQPAFRAPDFSH